MNEDREHLLYYVNLAMQSNARTMDYFAHIGDGWLGAIMGYKEATALQRRLMDLQLKGMHVDEDVSE
jgi:hypothetical protein